MKNVYTIEHLRAGLEEIVRLGVIGDPVAHSRSPQMMNAALQYCGLPHSYARFLIPPNELMEALFLMRERDFVGVNLTVPHKIAAVPAMDYVEETAAAIGALNTVQIRHGKMRGSNTDAIGFAKAVRGEFDLDVRNVRVLILGAGGASRAIQHACRRPVVWSRREHSRADLLQMMDDADLVVNATPVGLSPNDKPLLTRDAFRTDQFVFDTIYEPARTSLLDEAIAAGARAANGLSMLLHQGAAAFEIWFNRAAPLEVMRAALRELS